MMKRVLISGGSKGIGQQIGIRLARDGFHPILLGRSVDVLERTVNQINAFGGTATWLEVDFAAPGYVDLVRDSLDQYGLRPNSLVHALGGGFGSKTSDGVDTYREVMHHNFFVAHELTQLVLKNAVSDGWGRFLYIGTLAVNQKSASAPYVAAKSALLAYMKVIAKDMARLNSNISACAVSPGAINVPGKYFNQLLDSEPDRLKQLLEESGVAAGRLGEPEEVATVASFLFDSRSTYLNGCNIDIDGAASN